MSKKLTTGEFISKSKLIHGDKYDYSKVEYVNNHSKVCIICPEHGEFWQTPANHLKNRGCPICGGHQKSSTEEFIKRANKVHNNKYDYSKVDYKGLKKKVCIVCKEHGDFVDNLAKDDLYFTNKEDLKNMIEGWDNQLEKQ